MNQETLQILVFASIFLSLVKNTASHFLFVVLYLPMYRALYKRRFEPPTSQSMSKEKSRNIVNSGIQSYITTFSQKYFTLSVNALCTERFEQPLSMSRSKKKIAHINIWSCNL